MHDHVGAEHERVLQGGGREGVVHDEEGVGVVGHLRPRGDVRDAQQRVGRRLEPQDLGASGEDGLRGVGRGGGRHEAVLDTPLGQHLVHEAERAAVDVRGEHDVIPRGKDRAQQGVLRGHAGGEREGPGALLEGGELFLETVACGIGTAAVFVAPGAELVHAVLDKRGGLVNGRDHGAGGRVGLLAVVDGARGESGQAGVGADHGVVSFGGCGQLSGPRWSTPSGAAVRAPGR